MKYSTSSGLCQCGKPRTYKNIWHRKKPIREHRVVMERHLGRPLLTEEHVHHINHCVHDNRIENLEIMEPEQHGRHHASLIAQAAGHPTHFRQCWFCHQFDDPTNLRKYKNRGGHIHPACERERSRQRWQAMTPEQRAKHNS